MSSDLTTFVPTMDDLHQSNQRLTRHLKEQFDQWKIYHRLGPGGVLVVNPGKIDRGKEGGGKAGRSEAGESMLGEKMEDTLVEEERGLMNLIKDYLGPDLVRPTFSPSDLPEGRPHSQDHSPPEDEVGSQPHPTQSIRSESTNNGKGKKYQLPTLKPTTLPSKPFNLIPNPKLTGMSTTSTTQKEEQAGLPGFQKGTTVQFHTIVATGTSGSGKTTVLNKILGFVATDHRGRSCSALKVDEGVGLDRDVPPAGNMKKDDSTGTKRVCEIKVDVEHDGGEMGIQRERLRHTMRLTEGMGNAKTLNNPDSSRCAKLIEIHLKQPTEHAGSSFTFNIKPLMLEPTRLLSLGRAFQSSLNQADKHDQERSFHIFYYLLARGHSSLSPEVLVRAYPEELQGKGDDRGWEQVDESFKYLAGSGGAGDRIVKNTWDALAAIILLMTAESVHDDMVVEALRLLGVQGAGPFGEGNTKQGEDKDRLFCFARAVYLKLFNFWTKRGGGKLDGQPDRVIRFIDICGFETLQSNRLAQLIINITNDRMYTKYMETVLSQEMSKSPESTIQTNEKLLEAIRMNSNVNRLRLALPQVSQASDGKVIVNGSGKSLRLKVKHSHGMFVPYVYETFPTDNVTTHHFKDLDTCTTLAFLRPAVRTNTVATPSIISSSTNEWRAINEAFVKAKVLFVRCIQASPSLAPWEFDTEWIKHQVGCLAIVPTLGMLYQRGLNESATKEVFVRRYSALLDDKVQQTETSEKASPWEQRWNEPLKSLIQKVSDHNERDWSRSYVAQGHMVFYEKELTDRLDILLANMSKASMKTVSKTIPDQSLPAQPHAASAASPEAPSGSSREPVLIIDRLFSQKNSAGERSLLAQAVPESIASAVRKALAWRYDAKHSNSQPMIFAKEILRPLLDGLHQVEHAIPSLALQQAIERIMIRAIEESLWNGNGNSMVDALLSTLKEHRSKGEDGRLLARIADVLSWRIFGMSALSADPAEHEHYAKAAIELREIGIHRFKASL